MLRFRSLGSGSSGNATLIEGGDDIRRTRVLVDCGLGVRELERRLLASGTTLDALDAIFITHEHADHIGCAPALAARLGIPLWMSEGTRLALPPAAAACGSVQIACDGEAITVGALELLPFTVPHDAREPLQLTCTDGVARLGLLTDLGHVSSYVTERLRGCSALLLECNHDPELLERGPYPAFLKRRVGGLWGHLSNGAAASLLRELGHGSLRHVVAAHLSERNNTPALAREALAAALDCAPSEVLVADGSEGCPWLMA